jgi:hypothetical protein
MEVEHVGPDRGFRLQMESGAAVLEGYLLHVRVVAGTAEDLEEAVRWVKGVAVSGRVAAVGPLEPENDPRQDWFREGRRECGLEVPMRMVAPWLVRNIKGVEEQCYASVPMEQILKKKPDTT